MDLGASGEAPNRDLDLGGQRVNGPISGERVRDQARRDSLEPERAAHQNHGYPVDRQRAATREADSARAGQGDLRARSRQPQAAGTQDLWEHAGLDCKQVRLSISCSIRAP